MAILTLSFIDMAAVAAEGAAAAFFRVVSRRLLMP